MTNGFTVLAGAVLLVFLSCASNSRADTIIYANAVSVLANG